MTGCWLSHFFLKILSSWATRQLEWPIRWGDEEKQCVEGLGVASLGLGSLVAVAEMGRGFRDWEQRTLSHCIVGGKRKGGKICFSHMPFFKMWSMNLGHRLEADGPGLNVGSITNCVTVDKLLGLSVPQSSLPVTCG